MKPFTAEAQRAQDYAERARKVANTLKIFQRFYAKLHGIKFSLQSSAFSAPVRWVQHLHKPIKLAGIGRTATPQEIKAWDIDVRPDFKGLPAGQGSARQGEVIWEAKCTSCHGSFAESSEVFTPIAGGTTADDIKTGHVKSLLPGANQPQRTSRSVPA